MHPIYQIAVLAGLLANCFSLFSQTAIPFTSAEWEFSGEHQLLEFQGKSAVLLKNGHAELPNVLLKNGIIEYDIAFDESRGFSGVHFRMQDSQNYEEYYMRAHQSGNPDAMQYTPVFNGISAWQLYHGPGHAVAHSYRFNEWMRVRLIIADQQMEVYIDDMTSPVLHVFDLKATPKAGHLGLYTFVKGAYFANFSFQEIPLPRLHSETTSIPELEEGTVPSWQVSEAFSATEILEKTQLKEAELTSHTWTELSSEYTGTVNLSRVAKHSQEANTSLATFSVTSGKSQVKALHFGYSDAVSVYVNGQLWYGGQRLFRSRDYRYLGTIGYFDTLFIPLKKGKNVIVFAVGETMGGWGVRAKFEDMEGLTF